MEVREQFRIVAAVTVLNAAWQSVFGFLTVVAPTMPMFDTWTDIVVKSGTEWINQVTSAEGFVAIALIGLSLFSRRIMEKLKQQWDGIPKRWAAVALLVWFGWVVAATTHQELSGARNEVATLRAARDAALRSSSAVAAERDELQRQRQEQGVMEQRIAELERDLDQARQQQQPVVVQMPEPEDRAQVQFNNLSFTVNPQFSADQDVVIQIEMRNIGPSDATRFRYIGFGEVSPLRSTEAEENRWKAFLAIVDLPDEQRSTALRAFGVERSDWTTPETLGVTAVRWNLRVDAERVNAIRANPNARVYANVLMEWEDDRGPRRRGLCRRIAYVPEGNQIDTEGCFSYVED